MTQSDEHLLINKMKRLGVEYPSHFNKLNKYADELRSALDLKPFNAKKVLGAWARARKVYCDITGESLI